MIPYAVEIKDITNHHLELYKHVVIGVDRLEDGLDCHQVCARLAAEIPGLVHVRGHFLHRGLPHSWLAVKGSETLIDPYPWAGAMPIIVTQASPLNPWRQLYIEEGNRSPMVLVERDRLIGLLMRIAEEQVPLFSSNRLHNLHGDVTKLLDDLTGQTPESRKRVPL